MTNLESLKQQLQENAEALKNQFYAFLQTSGLSGSEIAGVYEPFCRRVDAQLAQALNTLEEMEATSHDAQQTAQRMAVADPARAKELLADFMTRQLPRT